MDDENDGGIQEWEESRFRRADDADARLLEEYRKWRAEFEANNEEIML